MFLWKCHCESLKLRNDFSLPGCRSHPQSIAGDTLHSLFLSALPHSLRDRGGLPPCQRVKPVVVFLRGVLCWHCALILVFCSFFFPNICPWYENHRLVILFSLAFAFAPWVPYSTSSPCALSQQKTDITKENCSDALLWLLTSVKGKPRGFEADVWLKVKQWGWGRGSSLSSAWLLFIWTHIHHALACRY